MKNKAKLLSTLLFSSVFFSCSYVSNKPITITGVATPTPIPVMTNQIKNTEPVINEVISNPNLIPSQSPTPIVIEQNSSTSKISTSTNVLTNFSGGGSGATLGSTFFSTTGLPKEWIDGKTLIKNDNFKIDSIFLTDTNKRMDEDGTYSITPDYSGTDIFITINGTFNTEFIKESDMKFENEPNLLQISYIGENIPKTKVLIDDSIVANFISANDKQIKYLGKN